MKTQDERIAALEADQRLEDRRSHRIGHRDEAENGAHGRGDFGDLQRCVLAHDPRAAPAEQVAADAGGRDQVLPAFVLGVAVARDFDRELRPFGGAGDAEIDDRLDHAVDRFLIHGGKPRTDFARAAGERFDFLVGALDEDLREALVGGAQLGRRFAAEGGEEVCRHERMGRRELGEVGGLQLARHHLGLRHGGRGTRLTVEQRKFTKHTAGAHVAEHVVGIDMVTRKLDSHAPRFDQITGVRLVALTEDDCVGRKRHRLHIGCEHRGVRGGHLREQIGHEESDGRVAETRIRLGCAALGA